MHARICHIIEQILTNNDILLKDIDIVTEEERHQLLYEFNKPSIEFPKNATIVSLFEKQVSLTPNNIAVKFEDNFLTYKELNSKANQLARYILNSGAKKAI